MKVDAKYDQFIGRVVNVVESTFEYKGKSYPTQETDESQEPLKELIKQATQDDLQVRVWLPTTIGTMDLRNDRLNVYIDKTNDGLYKINRLKIG